MLNWFDRWQSRHLLTGMMILAASFFTGFWYFGPEDDFSASLVLEQGYQWSDSIPLQPDIYENLLDPSRFFSPENQDKPWIVWHWPGTDVDLRTVLTELTRFSDQGFGGVEIQVTGKGIQPSHRKGNFRDPSWMYLQEQTRAFGRSVGLQIDWTLGPGIPAEYTGGQKMLTWGEIHLLGGRELTCKIPAPTMPVGHHFASSLNRSERQDEAWLSWLPDSSKLLGCWISQVQDDQRQMAFWETTDQLILNPDSTWNVSSFLRGDTLTGWKAGPGYWKLIAVYETQAGASPFHSVASFSEHVGDLLSPEDLKAGLLIHPYFESIPYDSTGEQGIRYKPQIPTVDRLVPPSIDQFLYMLGESRQKGILPLVLCEPFRNHTGAARHQIATKPTYVLSDQDEHLRQAYESWIVSDPLVKGLEGLNEIIHSKGAHARVVVDDWPFGWEQICRMVDQPSFNQDISGANRLSATLVSDLAYSWGKKYTGAYVGAAPDMAYNNSPEKLKHQVDLAYLAGATRIYVESEAYQSSEEKFWHPGIDPFLQGINEGGQFGPRDPMAKWWPDLWTYMARTSYLQKLGEKETDVLVLFPHTAFPPRLFMKEWSMIPGYDPTGIDHLSGVTQALLDQKESEIEGWVREISHYLLELEQAGITWDWVTESMVEELRDSKLSMASSESEEQMTLIIPEGGTMKLETGKTLLDLQEKQLVNVLVLGEQSSSVSTFSRPDSSQLILESILDELRPQFPLTNGKQLCTRLLSEEIQLSFSYIQPSRCVKKQVRKMKDGSSLLHLINSGAEECAVTIWLGEETGWELDPYSGKASRLISEEGGLCTLTFFPHESRYFWLGESLSWPDSLAVPAPRRLSGEMVYRAGVELIPLEGWEWTYPDPTASQPEVRTEIRPLVSWTEVDGLESFYGEVGYSTDLYIDSVESKIEYFLDLGTVADVMELEINTRIHRLRPWPPYLLSLNSYLQPGLNTIKVWVRNTRRNEVISRANQGDPSVSWLQATRDDLQPAGMIGPVFIWKVGAETVF